MEKALRNTLRITITQARKILEKAMEDQLEGRFGIHANGQAEDLSKLGNLSTEDQHYREQILAHIAHIHAAGSRLPDAFSQIVREMAFTHLNRLCAYKLMEKRQLIRDAVGKGLRSNGFQFYLADHPDEELLFDTGDQERAYRHFLRWLAESFAEELGELFSPHDSASRLYPPQRVLEQVVELLNDAALNGVWAEDETIGWIYQYFTPDELRNQVRDESQAPRNSYELAFRNQFFTPRYVVRFLVDNTLGRMWYEMRQGQTALVDHCTYLARRPDEVFFDVPAWKEVTSAQHWLQGEVVAEPDLWALSHTVNGYRRHEAFKEETIAWVKDKRARLLQGEASTFKTQELLDLHFLLCRMERFSEGTLEHASQEIKFAQAALRERVTDQQCPDRTQEELLRAPVWIANRAPKDPRELKIIDPACGSGHFLLYCFDLLTTIYEEAYTDEIAGKELRQDYPTLKALHKDIPSLILAHNLHGIDIDRRATQIATLALWLRAQRAYKDLGLKRDQRPKIMDSNIVCAEPMPGESDLLKEFTVQLQPPILDELVTTIFEKMKLASEAGSLLKIEKEIASAIQEAKKRWYTPTQLSLLSDAPVANIEDDSSHTDTEFWGEAEKSVMKTLRDYAHSVMNGQSFARELFADDAVRGFAFIDICKKRYDVVLMNPPFGLGTNKLKEYISDEYTEGKSDLAAAMIERGVSILTDNGLLGALTTRNLILLPSFEKWRIRYMLSKGQLETIADLGYGVLDGAVVEAAAYVIGPGHESMRLMFSCLDVVDKAPKLLEMISKSPRGECLQGTYLHKPSKFVYFPAAVMAYSIPESFAEKIISWPKLESYGVSSKQGMNSSDDERFLRTAWEVAPLKIGLGKHWVFLAKGGEWNPFWDDIHLLIDWSDNGKPIIAAGATVRNSSVYFTSGLTYPERTTSNFGPRILPDACIFSTAGQAIIFSENSSPLCYLGLLLSRPSQLLIEMSLGGGDSSISGTAARHYTNGMINRLPFPSIEPKMMSTISDVVKKIVNIKRKLFGTDESSRTFTALPINQKNTVLDVSTAMELDYIDSCIELAEMIKKLELYAERVFNINNEDKNMLDEIVGPLSISYLPSNDLDKVETLMNHSNSELIEQLKQKLGRGARFITKNVQLIDRKFELISHLEEISLLDVLSIARQIIQSSKSKKTFETNLNIISYLTGCSFGRWNIRYATGELPTPELPNPFDPLPVCSPGMLIGDDGLPLKTPPADYPLNIKWDGIMVDDPDHPDDIVRRLREVLAVIWHDRAEAIEQEICQILEITDMRDYFRRPGKGGFWDDHIQHYSKSRRKAPIYWLLQSEKRNYGIWIYYHRLDKDLLFKALVNYVEPKLRMEEDTLAQLKAAINPTLVGREARQVEQKIERQERLLTELSDFRDKLSRAAHLDLEPDLNDGVALNIAPLRELVPWKEALKYWDELEKGKYEWSSISQQLHAKGKV